MSFKTLYTETATDVADEFYPKGNHHRGEFIRDAAVLFAKFQPKAKAMMLQWIEEAKDSATPLAYITKKIEELEKDD